MLAVIDVLYSIKIQDLVLLGFVFITLQSNTTVTAELEVSKFSSIACRLVLVVHLSTGCQTRKFK